MHLLCLPSFSHGVAPFLLTLFSRKYTFSVFHASSIYNLTWNSSNRAEVGLPVWVSYNSSFHYIISLPVCSKSGDYSYITLVRENPAKFSADIMYLKCPLSKQSNLWRYLDSISSFFSWRAWLARFVSLYHILRSLYRSSNYPIYMFTISLRPILSLLYDAWLRSIVAVSNILPALNWMYTPL